MANGARTILLSRWRTGGQSSVDLVREFVQELPHASAAEAWQRSMMLVSENPLNATAEPRIRLTAHEEAPKAENPFFWAGYLLVDTGTLPQALADEQRKQNEVAGVAPAAGKPAIAGVPAAPNNPFGNADAAEATPRQPERLVGPPGIKSNPAMPIAQPGNGEPANNLFGNGAAAKPGGEPNDAPLGADPQEQPATKQAPQKRTGTKAQVREERRWRRNSRPGHSDQPLGGQRGRRRYTAEPTAPARKSAAAKSAGAKRDGPPAPIPPPGQADPDNFFPDAPAAGTVPPAKSGKPSRSSKTKPSSTKSAKGKAAPGPPAPIPAPAQDCASIRPPSPIPPPPNP